VNERDWWKKMAWLNGCNFVRLNFTPPVLVTNNGGNITTKLHHKIQERAKQMPPIVQ
jgi:hypothetical protein